MAAALAESDSDFCYTPTVDEYKIMEYSGFGTQFNRKQNNENL